MPIFGSSQGWGEFVLHNRLFREIILVVLIVLVIIFYYRSFATTARMRSNRLRQNKQTRNVLRTRMLLLTLTLGLVGVLVYDRVLPKWGIGAQEAVQTSSVAVKKSGSASQSDKKKAGNKQSEKKASGNQESSSEKKASESSEGSTKEKVVTKFAESTKIDDMTSDRAVQIVTNYYEKHPKDLKVKVDEFRFVEVGRDNDGNYFIVGGFKVEDGKYIERLRCRVRLDGLFDEI